MTELIRPPRLAQRLLDWYCDDPVKEEIAGDIEERFWDHYESLGPKRAKTNF